MIFTGRMHGFSALPALCSMRTADYSSPSTLMACILARSSPAKNPQHWFNTFEISYGCGLSLEAKPFTDEKFAAAIKAANAYGHTL